MEGRDNNDDGRTNTEGDQVQQFPSCLNTGLALHRLSTNERTRMQCLFACLNYRGFPCPACARTYIVSGEYAAASPNRKLFEGSAAIALALEASTLFYCLRRQCYAVVRMTQQVRILAVRWHRATPWPYRDAIWVLPGIQW